MHTDDKLNDEIVNTIPIIGVDAESRIYLLPSHAYEHIWKCKFETMEPWVKAFPPVDCRWVFGICQQRHWTAIAIYGRQGMIQHYDSVTGLSKRAEDIYKTEPPFRRSRDGPKISTVQVAREDAGVSSMFTARHRPQMTRVVWRVRRVGPAKVDAWSGGRREGVSRAVGVWDRNAESSPRDSQDARFTECGRSTRTTVEGEGEGTPAPDKGNNAVTSERDAKGVIKNVATTTSPK
ncbi:hypothetical protein LTR56_025010 [Elasticomyces elasticus]|nr:hypothetical protein LTR56_025010 [Elasticomyces elasticus]KAK3645808.1 hypothetical protein LTR22_014576 [Elasticomyces elasticus]KAK4906615.1 hypothetical protein LTR49_024262 [Elasticomyces elasticus]KAK5741555.1 hypothetical protein LTS12_024563 [Elasticomyces elasticus]